MLCPLLRCAKRNLRVARCDCFAGGASRTISTVSETYATRRLLPEERLKKIPDPTPLVPGVRAFIINVFSR